MGSLGPGGPKKFWTVGPPGDLGQTAFLTRGLTKGFGIPWTLEFQLPGIFFPGGPFGPNGVAKKRGPLPLGGLPPKFVFSFAPGDSPGRKFCFCKLLAKTLFSLVVSFWGQHGRAPMLMRALHSARVTPLPRRDQATMLLLGAMGQKNPGWRAKTKGMGLGAAVLQAGKLHFPPCMTVFS